MFFSQVPVLPCTNIPSPAADSMAYFTPSSFQSAEAGLGCEYFEVPQDRTLLSPTQLPHMTESGSITRHSPKQTAGCLCRMVPSLTGMKDQCCLKALEPHSYNHVHIPWPFHVLVFMTFRTPSIIIFLEITFKSFLSLSNKSLGEQPCKYYSFSLLPTLPLTFHLFSHLLALTEAEISLRSSVRQMQLFTVLSHLVHPVFEL